MSETATLQLNISDQKVEQLIQSELRARVLATLSAKSDAIMAQLVDRVINTKVDEDGKVSSSSYSNRYPLIDKCFEVSLQTVIRETIAEFVASQKPKIQAAVEKQIKSRPGTLAKAIVEASAKTLAAQYLRATVNVEYTSKD